MKQFILIVVLLFFALFEDVSADETCTAQDLKNLTICLQKYIPYGYRQQKYHVGSMLDTSNLFIDMAGVCRRKKHLNACLGNSIIKRCINIKNMSSVPYLATEDAAKVEIADFLKTDYVCQKLFNFTVNDVNCYTEKLPKSISKICKRDYSSCDGINEYSNCIRKLAYKKCRKYVGCFVQKVATLEKCSYSSCGGCGEISSGKRLIDNLCNDDQNSTTYY